MNIKIIKNTSNIRTFMAILIIYALTIKAIMLKSITNY